MMRFNIDISSDNQPGLLAALEACIRQIKSGRCYLNVDNSACNNGHLVKMNPSSENCEEVFRQLYAASHPVPEERWIE